VGTIATILSTTTVSTGGGQLQKTFECITDDVNLPGGVSGSPIRSIRTIAARACSRLRVVSGFESAPAFPGDVKGGLIRGYDFPSKNGNVSTGENQAPIYDKFIDEQAQIFLLHDSLI
jgi:hypothetical protein